MLKGKFVTLAAALSLCSLSSFAAYHTQSKPSPKANVAKQSATKSSDMNVDAISDEKSVDLQAKIKNDVPHLGVNFDVYAGYAFADWSHFTNGGHGAWALLGGGIRPRNHQQGGFNIGGDLGYQIIRYLGMEFGYYYFQKVNGDNLSITTPYYYFAGKLSYPFLANDDFSIFAKLGAALREIEYGGSARQGVYNNKRYSIRPIYGLGVQYYLSHRWKASVQWLEIPKYTDGAVNSKDSSKQVPRTDQVLFGLGYLFSI